MEAMEAAAEAREKLKAGFQLMANAFTCPVCLELVQSVSDATTMTLPCNHMVCGTCLRALMNHKQEKGKKLKCPSCKKEFDRRNVKDDTFLKDIATLFRDSLPKFGYRLDEKDNRMVLGVNSPSPPLPPLKALPREAEKRQAAPLARAPRLSSPLSTDSSSLDDEDDEDDEDFQPSRHPRPRKRGRPPCPLSSPSPTLPPKRQPFNPNDNDTMYWSAAADDAFGEDEEPRQQQQRASSAPAPRSKRRGREEVVSSAKRTRSPPPSSSSSSSSSSPSPPPRVASSRRSSKPPSVSDATMKPRASGRPRSSLPSQVRAETGHRPLPSSGSSSSRPTPPPPPPSRDQRPEVVAQPPAAVVPASQEARSFRVRDMVEVQSRTERGNKPGGVGRILAAHPVENQWVYDVRYVLDKRIEKGISPPFIKHHSLDMDHAARRRSAPSSSSIASSSSSDQVLAPQQQPSSRPTRRSLPSRISHQSGASNVPSSSSRHPAPPQPRDPTPPAKENVASRAAARPASEQQDKRAAPGGMPARRGCTGDSFVDKPRQMVLVATSLKERAMEQVRAFVKRFGARLEKEMGPTVTHVICHADKQMRAEQRTLKYLHGLLNRRWLLSSKWIADSLKDAELKAESAYELKGDVKANHLGAPIKARKSRLENRPPLFKGVTFAFHGDFPPPKPTRRDLERLITAGEGEILSTPSLPEDVRRTSTFVLCNQLPRDQREHRDEDELLPLVTSDWLLDSISNYGLQSVDKYHPS